MNNYRIKQIYDEYVVQKLEYDEWEPVCIRATHLQCVIWLRAMENVNALQNYLEHQ